MSIGVRVKRGNLDKAISRFNRKIKESNHLVDVVRRSRFIPNTEKRRREEYAGKKRTERKLKELGYAD